MHLWQDWVWRYLRFMLLLVSYFQLFVSLLLYIRQQFPSICRKQRKWDMSKNFWKLYLKIHILLVCYLLVLLCYHQIFYSHFLSDEITTNIVPITLYTFLAMGLSPIYESSKMLLQSFGNEKFVLHTSILINLASVMILTILQFLNVQTYWSLYFIYGLNLFVLSLIFLRHASSEKII